MFRTRHADDPPSQGPECPLCMDLYFEPVSLPCACTHRRTVCFVCLINIKEQNHGTVVCPYCRRACCDTQIKTDYYMEYKTEQFIKRKKVQYPNRPVYENDDQKRFLHEYKVWRSLALAEEFQYTAHNVHGEIDLAHGDTPGDGHRTQTVDEDAAALREDNPHDPPTGGEEALRRTQNNMAVDDPLELFPREPDNPVNDQADPEILDDDMDLVQAADPFQDAAQNLDNLNLLADFLNNDVLNQNEALAQVVQPAQREGHAYEQRREIYSILNLVLKIISKAMKMTCYAFLCIVFLTAAVYFVNTWTIPLMETLYNTSLETVNTTVLPLLQNLTSKIYDFTTTVIEQTYQWFDLRKAGTNPTLELICLGVPLAILIGLFVANVRPFFVVLSALLGKCFQFALFLWTIGLLNCLSYFASSYNAVIARDVYDNTSCALASFFILLAGFIAFTTLKYVV